MAGEIEGMYPLMYPDGIREITPETIRNVVTKCLAANIAVFDPDVILVDRIQTVNGADDPSRLSGIVEAYLAFELETGRFQMLSDALQLFFDQAQRLPVLFIVPIALEFIDLPGDLIEFLLDRGKTREFFFGFAGRFFFRFGFRGGSRFFFCR